MPANIKNKRKPKMRSKHSVSSVDAIPRAEAAVSRTDPEDEVIEEKDGEGEIYEDDDEATMEVESEDGKDIGNEEKKKSTD